jgi:Ca2+-binding EF-hand superfamily protein
LKNNGHKTTDKELNAIVRRLDLDADAKVTFNEFTDALRPVPRSH